MKFKVGCTIKQLQHLKPSAFKGASDPLEAEEWITRTEKVFNVLSCANEQKVPFVAFMLEGKANSWWGLEKHVLAKKGSPDMGDLPGGFPGEVLSRVHARAEGGQVPGAGPRGLDDGPI